MWWSWHETEANSSATHRNPRKPTLDGSPLLCPPVMMNVRDGCAPVLGMAGMARAVAMREAWRAAANMAACVVWKIADGRLFAKDWTESYVR